MTTKMHYLLALITFLLVSGCASTSHNPTAYHYTINTAQTANLNQKTIILASNNYGIPSRNYLKKHQDKVDNLVKKYLKQHGLSLKSSLLWEAAWRKAIQQHGQVYNPTTGKLNTNTHKKVMQSALSTIRAESVADLVVFTDLIERDVYFSPNAPHRTQWDGVERRVSVQGAGHGIPENFNWGKPAKAASLWINLLDVNTGVVFSSAGGIDLTQAIDRKNPRFKRRRSMLNNRDHLMEGIKLSFHPLIKMDQYPREGH